MDGQYITTVLKDISVPKPLNLTNSTVAMRKPVLILLVLLITSFISHSQSSLKGTVTDTTEKKESFQYGCQFIATA